jgi:hypothetical protein
MVSDGAESNYHSVSGGSQGSAGIFGDLDPTTATATDSTATSTAADNSTSVDDKLRVGIYSQQDVTAEARPSAAPVDVGFSAPSQFAERFDQTQLAMVMRQFGNLEFTNMASLDADMPHGRMDDEMTEHEAAFEVAEAERSEASYNGDRDTQEAFARVGTVVSRDSQIPERLLQTLDRLNRRETMSA